MCEVQSYPVCHFSSLPQFSSTIFIIIFWKNFVLGKPTEVIQKLYEDLDFLQYNLRIISSLESLRNQKLNFGCFLDYNLLFLNPSWNTGLVIIPCILPG